MWTMGQVLLMCPSHKYGVAESATGQFRVRCTGKFCRREGKVVHHTFELSTGKLVRTDEQSYRNPRELLGDTGVHP